MLEHGGNTDLALSYAQAARRALPEMPNIAGTLAWAYYNKGSYNLAIDLLQDAIRKAPNNSTFHYHLGLAYAKVKKEDEATKHLKKALQLGPNEAEANQIREALSQISGT
jgi:Flp pilus assembly protein TadD